MKTRDETEGSLRLERGKRLRWAVLSSLTVRPLAVLIPVLIVPVFIRYLGTDRYGLFETISGLAIWVGLANLGLGLGLRNRLMDCHVSGDRMLACKYVSTLFFVMLGIGLMGFLTIAGVTYAVPWRQVLNAENLAATDDLRLIIFMALAIPLVGVTLTYAPSIYSAYQETHRQNFWDGLSKIATLVACLLLPFTHFGILGAIIALSGIPLVVSLSNEFWLWFHAKPWLRPKWQLFDRSLLGGLLHDGLLLFCLSSAAMIMFQADRVVIGILRSSIEVAEFSMVNRCMMLAYGGLTLVLMPLWPAYGEAFRRGDVAWCLQKLRLTTKIGAVFIAAAGIALLVFRTPIFELLSGQQELIPSKLLIVGMVVGCLCRVWADCHSILLNGANVLRPQIALLGINALVAIVLNIAATHYFGNIGTVWSFPVAAALTTLWGYPLMVRKFLVHKQSHARVGC
jgi:O-antigen/teichoic acid export membrane protein